VQRQSGESDLAQLALYMLFALCCRAEVREVVKYLNVAVVVVFVCVCTVCVARAALG